MDLLAQMFIGGKARWNLRRFAYFFTISAISVLAFMQPISCIAQNAVNLQWNPNSDPGFGGYLIYCGTQSGTYTNRLDAGAATQVTISGLTNGITYYFSLTSYLLDGTESDFAPEVAYTPGSGTSPAGVLLTLSINSQGQPVISGSGIQNHIYEVDCTSDFSSWARLNNTTADQFGIFSFADTSPLPLTRSYRVKDLGP